MAGLFLLLYVILPIVFLVWFVQTLNAIRRDVARVADRLDALERGTTKAP